MRCLRSYEFEHLKSTVQENYSLSMENFRRRYRSQYFVCARHCNAVYGIAMDIDISMGIAPWNRDSGRCMYI